MKSVQPEPTPFDVGVYWLGLPVTNGSPRIPLHLRPYLEPEREIGSNFFLNDFGG
jgi:hypothetical protein